MFHLPGRTSLLLGSLLLSSALLSLGCDEYVGAPRASIQGLEQGTLTDSKSPLVVTFDRAIDPETLRLKVVKLVVDEEGNLADEDASNETELTVLYSYDATAKFPNEGGKGTLDDAGTQVSIVSENPWPIAEKLALLIEDGLTDADGSHKTIARERIVFTYLVKLNCAPSTDFVSGAYFFVGDVTQPIGTQVQLWSWIDVNPDTGEFVASFVNGDRNRDLAKCEALGLTCLESEACRTIPEAACVPPSEKAASIEEYPDYVVNYAPPTGYSFQASGCVDGQSGDKTFFVNVPVDVIVQSPAVSLTGTVLTATFAKEPDGVVRGGGTIVCDKVFLGTVESGKAEGTISARFVPSGEAPADLKHPEPPSE
jgi:hypothetical protein